jgi:RimJ/RimL family protein N-acetyltransferase
MLKPRIKDRPIEIETDRLILSKFHINDAAAFYELNADQDVMRYTGDVSFRSIEESRAFILDYDHYRKYGFGRWTVLSKSEGNAIGWCGIKYHEQGDYIDLGFRLLRSEWNKGFATEAALGCVEHAFENLGIDELVGRVARKNLASIRVLEKIGMTYWKEDTCEGIEDSLYYRLRNTEALIK